MTSEQIIEMAKQAGMDVFKSGFRYMDDFDIYEFAKLVAEAEREACAQIADKCAEQIIEHNFSMLIAHQIRTRGEA